MCDGARSRPEMGKRLDAAGGEEEKGGHPCLPGLALSSPTGVIEDPRFFFPAGFIVVSAFTAYLPNEISPRRERYRKHHLRASETEPRGRLSLSLS
jgi:hypothetical protein